MKKINYKLHTILHKYLSSLIGNNWSGSFNFNNEINNSKYDYEILLTNNDMVLYKLFSRDTFIDSGADFVNSKYKNDYIDSIIKKNNISDEVKLDNKGIVATPESIFLYIDDIINKLKNNEYQEHKFISIRTSFSLDIHNLNSFFDEFIELLEKLTGISKEIIKKGIDINILSPNHENEELLKNNYLDNVNIIGLQFGKLVSIRFSDLLMYSFCEYPISNTIKCPSFTFENNIVRLLDYWKCEVDTQEEKTWNYIDLEELESDVTYRKQISNTGFHSVIFYKNDYDEKDVDLFKCVRVYYNDNTKRGYIIPYVFLKQLSSDNINMMFEQLPEKWLKYFDNDKKELNTSFDILKYNFLNCIMNINLFNDFLNDMYCDSEKLNNFLKINQDIMEIYYGRDIASIIRDYSLNLDERVKLKNKFSVNSNKTIDSIFNNFIGEHFFDDYNLVNDFLNNFFYENSIFNVKKNINFNPNQGISLNHLLSTFFTQSNQCSFYISLISAIDRGAINLSTGIVKENNKVVYDSILKYGNQIYRVNIEDFLPTLDFACKLEIELCNMLCLEEEMYLELEWYLNYILEKMHENGEVFTEKDFKIFKELFNEKNIRNFDELIELYNYIRKKEELKESKLYNISKEQYESTLKRIHRRNWSD